MMEGLDDDDAKNDVCLLCIVLLNREFSFFIENFLFQCELSGYEIHVQYKTLL